MVTESYKTYYPGYKNFNLSIRNIDGILGISRAAVIHCIRNWWEKYGESECNYDVVTNIKWNKKTHRVENIKETIKW